MSPLKIAVCMLSYDGVATVSAVTDEATFGHTSQLLDGIREGIDDLATAVQQAAPA